MSRPGRSGRWPRTSGRRRRGAGPCRRAAPSGPGPAGPRSSVAPRAARPGPDGGGSWRTIRTTPAARPSPAVGAEALDEAGDARPRGGRGGLDVRAVGERPIGAGGRRRPGLDAGQRSRRHVRGRAGRDDGQLPQRLDDRRGRLRRAGRRRRRPPRKLADRWTAAGLRFCRSTRRGLALDRPADECRARRQRRDRVGRRRDEPGRGERRHVVPQLADDRRQRPRPRNVGEERPGRRDDRRLAADPLDRRQRRPRAGRRRERRRGGGDRLGCRSGSAGAASERPNGHGRRTVTPPQSVAC